MRQRFEQQYKLGFKPILETPVLLKSRDDVPALVMALLEIYKTEKYSNLIFSLLEDKILKGKEKTGRNGLNLWQIFVLAQFRLALNLDYDRLHYMANSDSTLRQLLGIETETGFERIEIGYQRILDNLHLLDNETLKKINNVVVEFGHGVFKKKETEALYLKTDSFVAENNVHFPTDYNLLWDSSRKAINTIKWFKKKYPSIEGWRKLKDWFKILKSLSRSVGQASASGGKDKDKRLKNITNEYLTKAIALRNKIEKFKKDFSINEIEDLAKLISLERFIKLIDKHIDLIERRIIKGEKIPHKEKLFSIFEEYTEWITKGKRRPNVELGKRLSITTDQYGLIIDYYIMENETDSEVVLPIADRVFSIYEVFSWSFDKGFWHIDNKYLLQTKIEKVIMPKKGKPNKQEFEEEHTSSFKKLKNAHSAVESNINQLENNGLDRCVDKGIENFTRYAALSILAYNLHKLAE
ncbi:MAG: ISNCY family transposase, partial [Bacteroidales bacterium]|nr:ISNCY family transposase [Bacteroidales bacterium]